MKPTNGKETKTKLTIGDIQILPIQDNDVVMIQGDFSNIDQQILSENFKVIKEKRKIDFAVFLTKKDTKIIIAGK